MASKAEVVEKVNGRIVTALEAEIAESGLPKAVVLGFVARGIFIGGMIAGIDSAVEINADPEVK